MYLYLKIAKLGSRNLEHKETKKRETIIKKQTKNVFQKQVQTSHGTQVCVFDFLQIYLF